jgi:glycosyltransferase involved in cell wall biosynthesis
MNLNVIAPICGTGYGIASLNLIKALAQRGHTPALFPQGQITLDNQADAYIIQGAVNRQETFDYNAPCLKIWHQFDLASFVGRGPSLGFPIFELNKFNPREQHHIKFPDKLFVTSLWAANIAKQYRDNVHVVPLGIDPTIFSPLAASISKRRKPRNSFVIANFGKWEKRKGHDIIADVFNRAFTPRDNVELWLFPSNPFLTKPQEDEWKNLYEHSVLGSKIWIHTRLNSHSEIRDAMNMADIGFFPSRAEGWNLELLEMMALGKHVIATNYSAHSEFCTHANTRLIGIEDEEVAKDGKWFFGQGEWAKLGPQQIDDMVDALRWGYNQWKAGTLGVNVEGVNTGEAFTWDNSARKIEEAL